MKRKTTLFMATLTCMGILTATAATATAKPFNLFEAETDECEPGEHLGNHYNAWQADPTKDGVKEFYTCCKCHHSYLKGSVPEGTWSDPKDLDDDVAEAIIELDDMRKMGPLWTAGNEDGLASKSFEYIGDGKFAIDKYAEHDYAYLKYNGETSRKWAIEATISNVDVGITEEDIHSPDGGVEWWNSPIGLAGWTEHGVNSFGALGNPQFNAFDNLLHLLPTHPSGVSGNFSNLMINAGGTMDSMIDIENGFKLTIIHDGNIYFYLVNDVYVGYNGKWMGPGMWEDDSPALCTYKSGGVWSDIKIHTGDEFAAWVDQFYGHYNDVQALFGTVYPSDYLINYGEVQNPISKSANQFFADTIDGGLFLTNNSADYVVRVDHKSNKYYFECDIDIEVPSAQWVQEGDFPWIGIGVGHVNEVDGGTRTMAVNPVIFQKDESKTAVNHKLNYIANPVGWQWEKIDIDASLAESIGTHYKAAILRDAGTVYYYINDQLVKTDTNPFVMGTSDAPDTPMIYNAWGGSARLGGIQLLTESNTVDAKLAELNN